MNDQILKWTPGDAEFEEWRIAKVDAYHLVMRAFWQLPLKIHDLDPDAALLLRILDALECRNSV